MSTLWAFISLLLGCSYQFQECMANCGGRCVRSRIGQLYHIIPVRLYTPQQLEDNIELLRQPRQQQIVQEVVVQNNFGEPGFGSHPFGGPPFGGKPGFGGLGRGFFGGGGPRGGFGGGSDFGRGRSGFGGGDFEFGRGFGRSYGAEEEEKQPPEEKQPITAKYNAPNLPVQTCAKSYVFSCEAVLKPVPCSASNNSGC